MTAFVDWTAQIHNAGATLHDPLSKAKRTLEKTTSAVHRVLSKEDGALRFEVALRLYHGWHKGWQQTPDLRAIMTTAADPGFPVDYCAPNVIFRSSLQFSHTLLSALPARLHEPHMVHLPNTLRQQRSDSQPTQKMVDTALAADLLHWARHSPDEWALVLAEDDDLVPPIFTAEAWIQPHGGRAFLVRTRTQGAYLKLTGLWRSLP